jgi:Protein of unknown function (DUF3140)
MAGSALHDDELWHEFHRVVNMSSRELADWLHTHSASPDTKSLPEKAGTLTGQQVLHVLGKRRSDLTPDDLELMRRVIRRVHAERRGNRESVAGRTGWRHRLMSLGHDPLKPT